MTSERSEIEALADGLDELTLHDATRTALIAGASAIPAVGALASVLADKYLPERRSARMVAFVRLLSDRLRSLGTRVDRDYIRTEEFASLAEEFIEAAGRARNHDKLSAFAAAAAALLAVDRPDVREVERNLDLLDELRPMHLWILGTIARGDTVTVGTGFGIGVADAAGAKLAVLGGAIGADAPLELADLVRRGLVYRVMADPANPVPDPEILLAVGRNLANLLTPLGRRFVDYVGTQALQNVSGITDSETDTEASRGS